MAVSTRKVRPKRILEFSGFESPLHTLLAKRSKRGFRYIYQSMDQAHPPRMIQRDGGIVKIKSNQRTYAIPYRALDGKPIRANTVDEFHLHLPQSDKVSPRFLPKFADELNRILRAGGKAFFTLQDDSEEAIHQINFWGKDPRFKVRFAWINEGFTDKKYSNEVAAQKPHALLARNLLRKFSNFWQYGVMVLIIEKRRIQAEAK